MPAPVPLNDAKFEDLKTKLKELFELDKSDLDFGIYRIMAAKNKDVTAFLDRQLKDVMRQTLTAHGVGAESKIEAEIAAARSAAEAAGFNPDESPKVKELTAKLATGGGVSAAELEADIYNHLLNFFNRYYDEGDFISKRRYKGDVYAIPYAGEEVTLHWANKDQYYIKSGEWHKDYRFKVAGKIVRFKLVEATQETNNNKESDDAKRRYILDAENPVETTDGELVLRFQFRVPTEVEKKALVEAEVTRIFGGKYDGGASRTKGDEREQFCADAEKRALAAVPAAWQSVVTVLAATEGKPARTVLGKHLDDFTARNTFDYFIHKDLGGFLSRELDFYIKNEVVRLDDLESLPADHLLRVQGKLKAIRAVAGHVIAFLASLENFQRKMWLKKKLVLNTNWLVTIDRIPPALRDTVAANAAQWSEWEKLGFKPAANGSLIQGAAWGTREYLDANDMLVVDTKLFERSFTAELLASDEVLSGAASVEDATTGVIVHSENRSALSMIEGTVGNRVSGVYIDPPYNTGDDGFNYKDNYKSSSWQSMMNQTVTAMRSLMASDSIFFASCDENEQLTFGFLLRGIFGSDAHVETITWNKRVPKNDKGIGNIHEFVYVFAMDPTSLKGEDNGLRMVKGDIQEIYEFVEKQRASGKDLTDTREELKKFYNKQGYDRGITLYCELDTNYKLWGKINMSWPSPKTEGPRYEVINPVTGVATPIPKNGWRWKEDTFRAAEKNGPEYKLPDGSLMKGRIWGSSGSRGRHIVRKMKNGS